VPPTPTDASPVAGVVLAAGSSARLGRNKLLLELNGETVVRRAVRTALLAGLDPVIVVLGHEAEQVRAALVGLPCEAVVNPDHARGVGSSLHAGVARVPAAAEAFVLILADMPFVTVEMLATLLARYRETEAPLLVCGYGEVEAPPSLFTRCLFGELLATDDERCAKKVVRAHRDVAVVVAWPETALQDIDVPNDYAQVRALLASRAVAE
jgi:molybdenum cofactor cytidylyltransferase